MAYNGGCHCGEVAFVVEGDTPTEAISCNCSHCRCKGLLLTFVDADAFLLLNGHDSLTDYYFNKRTIAHQFCRICGCQPFASGKAPDGTKMVAVNLRCVPSIELGSLTLQNVDGASF